MPTIVHFEIPANDIGRAKAFYEQLFGWKIEQFQGMDYWQITTDGEHAIGGGMIPRRSPEHSVTNYIDVDYVDERANQVEQLGGKVIVPKMAVPGMGWFVVCLDTENNPFGLWQSDPNAAT